MASPSCKTMLYDITCKIIIEETKRTPTPADCPLYKEAK